MKRIVLVSIVALIALTTLSFTAGKSVILRIRPYKDKVYVIKSCTKSTMTMKYPGQSMTTDATTEERYLFFAKEVSDNYNVFETQLDAFKTTITQMGQNITYDTDNPQNNSPILSQSGYNCYDTIIKKPNCVTYDKLGHIQELDSLKTFNLNSIIIELPENEITVGSEWTFIHPQDFNYFKAYWNMHVNVLEIKKKYAVLSIKGSADIPEANATGTSEGTWTIDLKTGMVINSINKFNATMKYSEYGLTVTANVSGTTTINVEEQ